jgi:hypothetical protein
VRSQIAQIQFGGPARRRQLLEICRTEADANSAVEDADCRRQSARSDHCGFELSCDLQAIRMGKTMGHQRRFERNDRPTSPESFGDRRRDNELGGDYEALLTAGSA